MTIPSPTADVSVLIGRGNRLQTEDPKMPDCSYLYETASDRIKAADLQGRAFTLTISRAGPENCAPQGDPDEVKVVCHFRESQRSFPLNKTNFLSISSFLGSPDPDHWAGQRITLYPTRTQYQGKEVDCIRVRPSQQPQQPTTTPAAAAVMTGQELAEQQHSQQYPAPDQLGPQGDDIPF